MPADDRSFPRCILGEAPSDCLIAWRRLIDHFEKTTRDHPRRFASKAFSFSRQLIRLSLPRQQLQRSENPTRATPRVGLHDGQPPVRLARRLAKKARLTSNLYRDCFISAMFHRAAMVFCRQKAPSMRLLPMSSTMVSLPRTSSAKPESHSRQSVAAGTTQRRC